LPQALPDNPLQFPPIISSPSKLASWYERSK